MPEFKVMKSILLAAAMTLGVAGAAAAAPQISEVTIAIGPKLQDKADVYGQRDLDLLTERLLREVTDELDRAAATGPAGASLKLTIVDAVPNHPTFKQLGDRPGLSIESFGVGGAAIEGTITYRDGRIEPVRYKWYETDIRQAYGGSTWYDAEYAFDSFARRLVRGDLYAAR
jgi:hypothetical protein